MRPDLILPVSARPEFVALPSDPAIPLTPEQEAALWGGDVDRVLLSILRGTLRESLREQEHQDTQAALDETTRRPRIVAMSEATKRRTFP